MNRIFSVRLIFTFLIGLIITSCVDQKQIAYFQKKPGEADTLNVAKAYVPKIQSGDILLIPISSLNALASSFFSPQAATQLPDNSVAGASGASATAIGTSQGSAPGSYLVDQKGDIELPLVGRLKVAGLSTSDARDTIKNRLKTFLKEPTVNVRFLNYRVSVMGEVAKPSVYIIQNESITLPEALSLAGDLTIFGKRDNILVIRDNQGKKEFGRVNLNSREVYNSPYYYLHPNDVVYVEPGKGRIAQTDKTYQILPIILSALSFITIIVTYTRK